MRLFSGAFFIDCIRPHYFQEVLMAPFTPPSLTIGVEEEYKIVDPETRELKY